MNVLTSLHNRSVDLGSCFEVNRGDEVEEEEERKHNNNYLGYRGTCDSQSERQTSVCGHVIVGVRTLWGRRKL